MIVWLEDRKDSVVTYIHRFRERSLKFEMLSSINEVMALLGDGIDLGSIIFVVDIMLVGVDDLNSIGIPNAPTARGNLAGQVFVQRVLRARESDYVQCPVIFLTERIVDEALLDEIATMKREGNGPVEVFQKYSEAHLNEMTSLLEGFEAEYRARKGGPPPKDDK